MKQFTKEFVDEIQQLIISASKAQSLFNSRFTNENYDSKAMYENTELLRKELNEVAKRMYEWYDAIGDLANDMDDIQEKIWEEDNK